MSIARLVSGLLKYVRTYKEPLNYEQGYKVVSNFLHSWFDYKVKGKENIPEPPVIVCSNHSSFLDMLVLAESVYPAKVSYLAKPEFFMYDRIMRKISKKYHLENLLGRTMEKAGKIVTDHSVEWGAIKINRKDVKKSALKQYVELAKTKNLGIFPEGHRTKTGELQELKPGAVIIMKRSGTPILPVGIQGTYHFLKDFLYKKRKIRVNIGEPINPKQYKKAEEALQELEKRIKNLINA